MIIQDTDSRLSFLAKSLGVSDLSQHLRTSGASILFKMLQFMDDDTGIESKSSAYSVSLRKMREFVPERQNRPKLHQAIKVKNLTEFMKFIDGASLSLVQLHNLLQSLQEYIETQVLEYERTRLLTNAFRIFVVLFVDKLEHPLLFHMAVTTLWKYVLDESRTYISCSLIIYIFSEISSRNPEVFKSHCIDAFEVMAPFLHSSSRHLALHCLRVLLRLLQQVWPEMVTPVVKKLRAIDSSFSLPSHSDIVVKDKILIEHLFDPLNPEHFKGFLVGPLLDSLCSPETISTLQRDSVLPSALIKRLLMLVKESTDEIILSDLALALGKIQSLVGSQSLDFEREPANMGESVAFQGLLKTLLDSSPTIAGLAARALSRILSIPEYLEVAKALDHSTFQMIDLFAGRYRKKMPPSKNGGEYSSILDLDHWSFDGSSSTAWTADLVCRILPYQPISRYHYLTAVIEQVPDIATQIFPFVVFNGLTDIDFKKYFESHLGSVFSSPGTCDPSLLNLFIRTVDYIRSQRHPDATNLFDNNQLWLSLNFEDVSRACISVKSYEHALLFAEIDLSLTHRSLAQAKNHSTLLDIFRNLEESDGFNGIMMLMDAQDFTESSVKQKLAYEKSWDYLTQMQEAELYIESPEPNQSVSGLSLALKNSGHYAVAQRFIEASLHHEPSILDSISLTDIYSDCCWRTGLSTVGSLYNGT